MSKTLSLFDVPVVESPRSVSDSASPMSIDEAASAVAMAPSYDAAIPHSQKLRQLISQRRATVLAQVGR